MKSKLVRKPSFGVLVRKRKVNYQTITAINPKCTRLFTRLLKASTHEILEEISNK